MSVLTSIRSFSLKAITLLVLIALAAGGGAYWHYRSVASERTRQLEQALVESQKRQEELARMIDRLTASKSLARIVVADQQRSTGGLITQTTLLLVMLGPDEQPVSRQTIVIPGHIAFFDALMVKFDHDAIAAAHPLRGCNVALLRRVYSEMVAPIDGTQIVNVGDIPPAYADPDEPRSEFEQTMWERFWDLCNDPKLAEEMGVRVAQGEVVYKPMKPGLLYELTIDASGGMNLEAHALPEAVAEVLESAALPGH